MKSKVILIPSPLGDSSDPIFKVLKELTKDLRIDHFYIESRKLPIKVINEIYPNREETVPISILNKKTQLRVVDEYISETEGRTVAIITDAGIPGISDPGTVFIRKAHKANYSIEPLIAASSITAALASSGLRGESFEYHGYLQRDKSKRIEEIQEIEAESRKSGKTHIFIETPFRNIHVWKDLLNFCSPTTELSISVDLFTTDQFIKTANIENWKRMKWPKLDDHQAVFLINAKPIIS